MHVLVTGATGFVGFHTVMALIRSGHSVRFAVRNREKMIALYTPFGVDVGDCVVADVTDEEGIASAMRGVDGVVHTAAMVSLDANKAEAVYNTNVNGTRNVVGQALAHNIDRILTISSVTALYRPGASSLNENSSPTAADSAYGRSKVEADAYVRERVSEGAPIATCYPATVLGPNDPAFSEGSQGIAIFYNQGIIVTDGGIQIIDVRDLAELNVRLLEEGETGPWVAGGHYLPWRTLGTVMDKVSGQRLRRLPVPASLLRVMGSAVDVIACFIPMDTPFTAEGARYATQWVPVDDRKIRRRMNFEYRALESTLAATTRGLVAGGHIAPRWATGLGSPESHASE
ncbi:SDR family NAD(P)-dependent oxidoreductase [Halioglobus pacificus]|uniref:Oxidoreductase n=1 Tax=Parahalioglobus pacificus TaxID=930806 RepID=A0A919CIC4_9GAMM|nr:SDR family NAD(P)-dependent oxidoreductase [Halioglobus pacificus]GHD27623.1 putative oxidoreductase [Halioglobus pacificus]